jgi:hypothetical protein
MEEHMQNFLNLIMNINSITPENAHDILNRVRIIYSSLEQQPLTFAMYKMAEAIMKSKEIN